MLKRAFVYCAIVAICGLPVVTTSVWAQQSQPGQSLSQNEAKWEMRHLFNLVATAAPDKASQLTLTQDGEIALYINAQKQLQLFDTSAGKELIAIDGQIGNFTLFEENKTRLLAIVNLATTDQAANISVYDLTQANQPILKSAFILPDGAKLSARIKPAFDRSGTKLILASENPNTLYMFEVATGRQLEQIPLNGAATNLTISHQDQRTILGVVQARIRTVSIFEVTETVKPVANFELPESFGLHSTNNVCFNRDASVAYIASYQGNQLFSFSTATGMRIDNYAVGDAPAQIAWSEREGQARLAVVNTGKHHGFLANSVSIIETNNEGLFQTATVFFPPRASNLTADSMVGFDKKGRYGVISSQKDGLLFFNALTGEPLTTFATTGDATSFAMDRQNQIASFNEHDNGAQLTLIRLKSIPAQPTTSTGQTTSQTNGVINKGNNEANTGSANSSSASLATAPTIATKTADKPHKQAQAEASTASSAPVKKFKTRIRRARLLRANKGLNLTIDGQNFPDGAQIVVNDQSLPTVRKSDRRLISKVSWKFLGGVCQLSIFVRNPDGQSSSIWNKAIKCNN